LSGKSIKFKLYPIRATLNELSHLGTQSPEPRAESRVPRLSPLLCGFEKGTNEFILFFDAHNRPLSQITGTQPAAGRN